MEEFVRITVLASIAVIAVGLAAFVTLFVVQMAVEVWRGD